MNIFISGGCKNGKSYHAQELARQMAAEQQAPLYYLATMIPADDEDRARIRRHLAEREGWGFDTIERGRDICGILPQAALGAGACTACGAACGTAQNEALRDATQGDPMRDAAVCGDPGACTVGSARGDSGVRTVSGAQSNSGACTACGAAQSDSGARTISGAPIDPRGVFLLDSVTALLSNEMFQLGGKIDLQAGGRLAAELAEFARRTGNTVFVSDYLYSDARRFDPYTESYRRALAAIDRTLAQICDQVVEVSFGLKYLYKDAGSVCISCTD